MIRIVVLPTYVCLMSHVVLTQALQDTRHTDQQTCLCTSPCRCQAHAPFIRLWAVCMDLDYPGLLAKVMEKHPGTGFEEVGPVVSIRSLLVLLVMSRGGG